MIGVVADDLTGAAELAAVGWRHGLRAVVVLAGPPPRDADLVCITTESRSLRPRAAGRRAAGAARTLKAAGAKWIFKKTDSVLRGQVTAEIEAIMRGLRVPVTLLLPANPSLGRTIKAGRYFVHGKPIHRTDFARDPEHPRRKAEVLKLLRRPAHHPLAVLAPGTEIPARGIYVGEVSNRADLENWVGVARRKHLLAGGAETFALALARRLHLATSHTRRPAPRPSPGDSNPAGELFLCGSTSDACRDFLRRSEANGVPLHALPASVRSGRPLVAEETRRVSGRLAFSLREHPRVILWPGVRRLLGRRRGRAFSAGLGKVAVSVLTQIPVQRIFAEGGATAAALVAVLNWRRMILIQEIAPGVVELAPEARLGPNLIMKPGSYAWPDSVTTLPERTAGADQGEVRNRKKRADPPAAGTIT